MSTKKHHLHELIKDTETAMLTTVNADGMLVSRPMVTQKCETDGHLWFITTNETVKVDEIEANPKVNLAYYNVATHEWVSASGVAAISKDQARIKELYSPEWSAWMPDEGGEYDGSATDPRFVLIDVDVETAHFMTSPVGPAEVVFPD